MPGPGHSPEATLLHSMSLGETFKRRTYGYREFRDALGDILRDGVLRRAGQLDPGFRERLMLAVTEVNGCRYCSYLHSRVALGTGMDDAEVRALLAGELESSPPEQLAGLMFAQHWAETRGRPARDAVERLVEEYGPETAANIVAAVQSIMLGNLYGNTFDALLWRLRGRSVPERGFFEIIAVLIGGVWVAPATWIGMAWRRLAGTAPEAVHPIDDVRRLAIDDGSAEANRDAA